MAHESSELLRLAALIAAAAAAHLALRRLSRRIPVWIGRNRRGGGAAPSPDWRRWTELALLVPKLAIWVGVARALLARVPELEMSRAAASMLLSHSLGEPLFTLGGRAYSALDLVTLPALLAALWLAVGAAVGLLRRQLARFSGGERGVHESIVTLAKILLVFFGTIVVFQAWGLDVSSLAFVASVLGVGLGFGLQNLANNFVSGIVIGLERPLQTGDYVTMGSLEGTVRRIGSRCTVIETTDRTSILVPNARLLENEVVNWSHGDPVVRVHVPVSVAYGSDVALVRRALLDAAVGHRRVLADPPPSVQFLGFGESGLEFRLLVWTREPRGQQHLRSDLNFRIEASLRGRQIEVPFPQRDLRLRDPEVLEAVRAWMRRTFDDDELAAARAPRRNQAAAPCAATSPDDRFDTAADWSDAEVAAAAGRMRAPGGVEIRDRRHLLTTYRRCFVGSEAVSWLVRAERLTRSQARELGQRMLDLGLLHHVLDEHGFRDAALFYRFRAGEASAVASDRGTPQASDYEEAAAASGGGAR